LEESPVDKILREKAEGEADERGRELVRQQYWTAALSPMLDPIIAEIRKGLEETLGFAQEGKRKGGPTPSFTVIGQSKLNAVATVEGTLTGYGDLVTDHSEANYKLAIDFKFGIDPYAEKQRLFPNLHAHMFGDRRPGVQAAEVRRVILDAISAKS
jgi:hypothetical protein